ncbi:MAG: cyclohexanone monooxygenase [Microbacteriaceae bacterium]|nr:cyclohexanone monooxygenase [Microbacteriaceae bacterium]
MSANKNAVHYDAIVVGAGMGGLYALKRLRDDGLSVIGFEGGGDVGGVWYHNSYPGARVDVESLAYSYQFDPELYREWKWKERYSAQPELQAYFSHVADRYDLRKDFKFNTYVIRAQWDADAHQYTVETDAGDTYTAQYLVMASGQLSKPRKPVFEGLDDFAGDWYQTSSWPKKPVDLAGKRVAVIGTGASGVQAITEIAKVASQLTVFQRTANYVMAAQNGPFDEARFTNAAADLVAYRELLETKGGGAEFPVDAGPASALTPEQQRAALDDHWSFGGHALNRVFSDQNTDIASNTIVGDYVRAKVAEVVKDPVLREKLTPNAYPLGTRRIGVADGYYETFNRDTVSLVDINADPILRIEAKGIRTASGLHEFDVIVFALGFTAFTGALDQANITNEKGQHVTDHWDRGPRAYLGLMTAGFPNLFLLTGPGSPAVLTNMLTANTQHVDYVADMLSYMREHGYDSVEVPTEAEEEWLAHLFELSEPLIRRTTRNYMAHHNADGTDVFIPYPGGNPNYLARIYDVRDDGYRGFVFS